MAMIEQVLIVIVIPNGMQFEKPPGISVADLNDAMVRPQHGVRKPADAGETIDRGLRQRATDADVGLREWSGRERRADACEMRSVEIREGGPALPRQAGDQRRAEHGQFPRQPVIAGRSFVVGAVAVELALGFADELARCECKPRVGLCRRRQVSRDEQQPGDIGQVMIAAPAFRPLEMAENVAAMVVEAVDQKTAEGFVGPPAGISCNVERYDPIGGANADIHRAGPVGAEARRVGAIEIDDLVAQFLNIVRRRAPSIAPRCREHGGDSQLREMLHPRELPRELDVGAGRKPDALLVEAVLGAPAVAGAKIEVPINGLVIGPRDQAPGLRSPFLIGSIDDRG